MVGSPWAMSLPWRAQEPHLPVPPPCFTLPPPSSLQDWLLNSDFSLLIQASALPRGSWIWGDNPQLLAPTTGSSSPFQLGPAWRTDAPRVGKVLPSPSARQGLATSSQTPHPPRCLCGCLAGACCRSTIKDGDFGGPPSPTLLALQEQDLEGMLPVSLPPALHVTKHRHTKTSVLQAAPGG